jgi:GNAT superfamily N-acetyltransferase
MLESYFCNKSKRFLVTELTEPYVEKAAALLASEWPTNIKQRCVNLGALTLTASNRDKSLRQMPVSLIMIDCDSDELVGHASIISIATSDKSTCGTVNLPFMQSVIVDKKMRGMGLAKRLMQLGEKYFVEYAKQIKGAQEPKNGLEVTQFEHLYLNTKDKQGFYEALGYVEIEPMLFFANKSNSKCNEIMKSLFKSISTPTNDIRIKVPLALPAPVSSLPPSPLPPPPPPPMPKRDDSSSSFSNKLSWYKKRVDFDN